MDLAMQRDLAVQRALEMVRVRVLKVPRKARELLGLKYFGDSEGKVSADRICLTVMP